MFSTASDSPDVNLFISPCLIFSSSPAKTLQEIRKVIKMNSYSIYLQVKLNNLLERLKSSKKRPLLNTKINKREALENLYKNRRKFYEKADFIVNNDNDKSQVLEKIKFKLNSYAEKITHKK